MHLQSPLCGVTKNNYGDDNLGKENLIQYNGQTPAIARENGRKGGVASGASKRRRKALREVFNELLPMEVKDEELRSALLAVGLEPTHETAIAFAAILRAERGDIEAARFIRDTRGEKPTNNIAVGNILDTPTTEIDFGKLSDAELYAMLDAAKQTEMYGPPDALPETEASS